MRQAAKFVLKIGIGLIPAPIYSSEIFSPTLALAQVRVL
jgi:hypothetical protein